MSTFKNIPKDYLCNICSTKYKTRQSLWNHNNKFHSTHNSTKNAVKCEVYTRKSTQNLKNESDNANISTNYKCQYCNKILSRSDSLKRHIENCKNKNSIIKELKEQNDDMQKQLTEMKNMISELLKTRKIHPKTLQKINNNLTNNINNGTVNNTTIIKFGSVNINSVLTSKEVMTVLYKPFISSEECVKLIHFNDKRPEYNNIFITNLKDDLAYIYDGTKFTTVTKNDVIMELIENYAEPYKKLHFLQATLSKKSEIF
jgi:DNA-directed RNA polymerase subunit RPC12/RpoP